MPTFFTFKIFQKFPHLKHLVTQKSSDFAYDFSLALHTQEAPKDILANRERLKAYFPQKTSYVLANQSHSANIVFIEKQDKPISQGWDSQASAIADCDALITQQSNLALGILTADCVPILLYDPVVQLIAVVHAGWKGTKAQILFKTIKQMQKEHGSNPKDILAGIAPSIGKCCYEIHLDVAQYFLQDSQAYTQKGDKYMLDLPYINQTQLLDAGLQKEHIELSHICTSCQNQNYFSYRKEQGCSGRFISMMALECK